MKLRITVEADVGEYIVPTLAEWMDKQRRVTVDGGHGEPSIAGTFVGATRIPEAPEPLYEALK